MMTNKFILITFIVKVIVLFLFFLVLYYYLSPGLLLFTAKLVNFSLTNLFEQFISSVILTNKTLEIVTFFSVDSSLKGQLAFDLNPLKYSYGFPLFLALIFSNKGLLIDKLLKSILAYFVILLTQTWGLSFDIIRHLVFEFNGAYASYFHFSSIQTLLLSFGSQLGFLILPSLTPILLWVYLEKKQFYRLVEKIR